MKEKTTAKGKVKVYCLSSDDKLLLLVISKLRSLKSGGFLKNWYQKLIDETLKNREPVFNSHNLIVDQGLSIYPILLQNQTVPSISIAIGTNSTAAAVTQTNLGAKVAEDLSPSASASSGTCTIYGIISDSWAGTFYEYGLYIGGYMHSRIVDAGGITKATDEPIVIQWTLSYARG